MKVRTTSAKTMVCFLLAFVWLTLPGQDLYTISSASFNTRDYDEFAMVPFKNGFVLCSNRPQNVFVIRTDSAGQPLSDFYFVKRKENQKWASPTLFAGELNSRFYEGPATFSKDGALMFFTLGNTDTEGIYSSVFNGSAWEQPAPFQFNESKTISAQPFLSADGEKLFFASNRRGGQGGFDLYVCTLAKNNQWNRPKNLGPEINSAADDKYPYFHANGKLYFSSNRENGHGAFDIYYTQEINGKWIRPILLPLPLNSKGNDLAFSSDSIDRHGFISSDRNNRFKLLDVLEFSMNFPVIDIQNCKAQKINKYIYDFEESSSINTDTTTFKYEWDFGDGTKIRGTELKVEHKFAKPGDYLVQLNVIDTLTGNVELNQASSIFPVRDHEQPFIDCPDSADVNQEIRFDASKTYLPEKQILDYYWDFNDGAIAIGKEVRHTFLEPGAYKIILAVTFIDSNNNKITESRYKKILITSASQ